MELPAPRVASPRYGCYAAHFQSVPTERLVREAWARRHQGGPDTFLVALHERADRSVFEASVRLIRSRNRDRRILGLRILRELGPAEERPVFWETWDILERLARREKDPDVLAWVLCCLGQLRAPRALDTLLLFADSADSNLRFEVANHLMGVVSDPDDPGAVDLLVGFCEDGDPEVRWTALYDFAEFVTLDSPRIRAMLHARLEDQDEQIRTLAQRALASRR